MGDIIEFANKITPHNWQFVEYANFEKAEFKPRSVLIEIGFFESNNDLDEENVGEADPLICRPISIYSLCYEKAKKEYQRKGEFCICTSKIELNESFPFESTVIHELGHVIASRMVMRLPQKTSTSFPIYSHVIFEKNHDQHGEIFQSAYETIIKRVEKVYGADLTWHNRADLEMYRERTQIAI